MSHEACNHVREMRECLDGAEMKAEHKAILYVLADHHNSTTRRCDVGRFALSAESLVPETSLKRFLNYLEDHLVIKRQTRANAGRGQVTNYVFMALDAPQELAQKLGQLEKVGHAGPLCTAAESGPEVGQNEPESGPEVGQNGSRNKEESIIKYNRESSTARRALKNWLAIKADLERMLPEAEVKLWVRPARLLRLIGGGLLIALPPSNRIITTAAARKAMLIEVVKRYGYAGVSFTRYPDEYDRERMQREFPKFFEEMFGNGKRRKTA